MVRCIGTYLDLARSYCPRLVLASVVPRVLTPRGLSQLCTYETLKPECTLAELGIKLMVTKSLQNNPKMLLILFFIFGVDQDVINEHHDKLVQLWHEYEVHQVYEMCRSFGESKQHNQILIQLIECSLRNVF
jgi:hypothetical protein